MLLISGVAADIDWSSYFVGAPAFLTWHRTASHSLLGAAVIAVIVAAAFTRAPSRELTFWARFFPALVVCLAAAGMHILLDLAHSYGVKLLWPFGTQWYAWDLLAEVDPVLLLIFVSGLLIPMLLNLVSEEIGSRARRRPGMLGALIALAIATSYLGARVILHERALVLLNSQSYLTEAPLRIGAFPSVSPFTWQGIVETESALHEAEISVIPNAPFDPRTAVNRFKPQDSLALTEAVRGGVARAFLEFARFPLASIETMEDGSEVQIRDLRFSSEGTGAIPMAARIRLGANGKVAASAIEFRAR
jgi:membrane-bound metal-dependent hydrolase YbcI (DUF457 family)